MVRQVALREACRNDCQRGLAKDAKSGQVEFFTKVRARPSQLEAGRAVMLDMQKGVICSFGGREETRSKRQVPIWASCARGLFGRIFLEHIRKKAADGGCRRSGHMARQLSPSAAKATFRFFRRLP